MPTGTAAWNGLNGGSVDTQAEAEASAPTGDATLSTSNPPPYPDGGSYCNTQNSNPKLYIQTSSNAANGVNQLALAIQTGTATEVTIGYDLEMINPGTGRSMGIVLQYRMGNSGSWTSVASSAVVYSGASSNGGDSDTAGDIDTYGFTVTGLSQNTDYQFRFAVWRFGASGNSVGVAFDNISFTGNTVTACVAPANQPTVLFLSPNIISMEVAFTAATGSPAADGYLVLRSTTPDPACMPTDGITYTVGSSLGDCTVVSAGTLTNLKDSGLQPATMYYYRIFAYNNTGNTGCPAYRTSTPLSGNISTFSAPAIVISEVDADSPGTDQAEFVELQGDPSEPLDELALVFFSGNDDASYTVVDLDGHQLDVNGFFVVCTNASGATPGVTHVSNCDFDSPVSSNFIQNGADAVGLYLGHTADFPNGTPATTTNLLDALVYGTGQGDDAGLLAALGQTGVGQINENNNGNSAFESMQRETNWFIVPPTPGVANIVLPVSLTRFSGKKLGNGILLAWETASEFQNSHFVLERSIDGAVFTALATLKGAGTTSQALAYSFLDKKPAAGLHYYRLRQVDFDGKSYLSRMVVVEFYPKMAINVAPTVTAYWVGVELSEPTATALCQLFDTSGNLVKSWELLPSTLDNKLDISDLEAAIYFLQVQTEHTAATFKILKQR